jgi:hypothetical protein
MGGCIGWIDKWMDGWGKGSYGWMDGWMDGGRGGMDGWMDGWMNGWTGAVITELSLHVYVEHAATCGATQLHKQIDRWVDAQVDR